MKTLHLTQIDRIRLLIPLLTAALVVPLLLANAAAESAKSQDLSDELLALQTRRAMAVSGPEQPMHLALSARTERSGDVRIAVTSSAQTRKTEKSVPRSYELAKSKRGYPKPAGKPSDFGRDTTYRVKPGDLLEISIWKEPDMRREMLVLPDGTISYPLAGHTQVVGMTPKEIEQILTRRLSSYFKDPFINVIVKRTTGNQIYVLGEVRNPGAFEITAPVDVMQALSLAGGLSEFADKGEIIVLRRAAGGRQEVISFKYSSVQRGKNLTSNVTLLSGDTVVVPERGLF